jgi:ComF family protein
MPWSETTSITARAIFDGLASVLLAPTCAICGETLASPTAGLVCATCWTAAACAAPRYEGALRDAIHAFKYQGRSTLAAPLAELARGHSSESLRGCHCAIPVPLHPWRRLRRGFNQAHEIAAALHLPVVHALWRIRPTAPQTRLGAAARHRNVRNAFMLSPWMRIAKVRAMWLEDRVVLLVDDVRTTGATLESCAEVLKRAGVREIRTLTVARTAVPRL